MIEVRRIKTAMMNLTTMMMMKMTSLKWRWVMWSSVTFGVGLGIYIH